MTLATATKRLWILASNRALTCLPHSLSILSSPVCGRGVSSAFHAPLSLSQRPAVRNHRDLNSVPDLDSIIYIVFSIVGSGHGSPAIQSSTGSVMMRLVYFQTAVVVNCHMVLKPFSLFPLRIWRPERNSGMEERLWENGRAGRVEDVVDERSEQWRTRSRVICTVSGPVDKGDCTAFKRTACCRAGISRFLDIKEIWFVALSSTFPSSGYLLTRSVQNES